MLHYLLHLYESSIYVNDKAPRDVLNHESEIPPYWNFRLRKDLPIILQNWQFFRRRGEG